ncbi:GNAT family N-acetyltransferase [Streptomyces caeruleatus]|uniref:Acetyltransferase n=1 Tax=Streptomyces caeruleatus TaxID=661399 RepID=A0A117RRG1_9ACTN|nr:GNAT family N-acetyltransferase [Streptomyces caeruleatus]KUO05197.1 hypothetical protein AQJ67_07365 [Streptomyces caeruleatus]
MALVLDAPPAPSLPPRAGGWALRPTTDPAEASRRGARAYTATCDAGPPVRLEIHRVPHHPLRACYPFGAHDLVLSVTPATEVAPITDLLRGLLPALFTADPRCRRIIAAPAECDSATQLTLEAAGFRRVTEADLPDGSVVLYTAEPPSVTGVSTALDDMPH